MTNRTFPAWPLLMLGTAHALASPAVAATCTVPNAIVNGQVADATRIMDNFNAVANCAQQGVTTTGTPTTGSIPVFTGSSTIGSGNLSGDVITSGGTSTTLASSGVTPGSYTSANITVDAKGRVVSAASGTGGGGSGAIIFLGAQTAANSAALTLANVISSSYDDYIIEFVNLTLSDNNTSLEILFSHDNGASWDSSPVYDTAMFQIDQAAFASNASQGGGGYGYITQGYSNSPSNALNGRMELFSPLSANYKFMTFDSTTLKSDGNFYDNNGSIRYKSNSAINAIKIISSSGTISSGFVRIYAMAH